MASPTGPHNLNFDGSPGANVAMGSGPGDPTTPAGQAILAANGALAGPNAAAINFAQAGIPTHPNWPTGYKLTLNPGDELGGPSGSATRGYKLYTVSLYATDPSESGVLNPPPGSSDKERFYSGQAWFYHGQTKWMVARIRLPASDFDSNPGAKDTVPGSIKARPYLQSAKFLEFAGHSTGPIDGIGSFLPTGALNGHNNPGIQAVFNRIGLGKQFGVRPSSAVNPWFNQATGTGTLSGGPPPTVTPQSSDWRQAHFQPKFVTARDSNPGNLSLDNTLAVAGTDDRPYWGFAWGGGDVTSHDNTDQWPLRPVNPDEWMTIIIEYLLHDTAGGTRIWANTDDELSALTVNTPPLAVFLGSTNQYALGTSAFDPENPISKVADSPQRLTQQPRDPLPGILYNGQNNPPVPFSVYLHSRIRTSLAAAMAEVNGTIQPDPKPVFSGNASISGSAVVPSVLTAVAPPVTGIPTPILSYQWNRSGTPLPGATSQNYTLVTGDIAKTMTVTITATNTAGTDVRTSGGVGPIQAASAVTLVHEVAVAFAVYGASDSQIVTVPAVANRVLRFTFAGKTGIDPLSPPTVNGAFMSLVAARGQGQARLEVWQLINPPVGMVTVAWSKAGLNQNVTWGVDIYSGVNQTTPATSAVQAGATQDGSGAAKTIALASATGYVVHTASCFVGGSTSSGPAVAQPQMVGWSTHQSTTQGSTASVSGAPTVTVSVTPAGTPNYDWALIADSLIPAVVVPAKPTIQQIPEIAGSAIKDQLLSRSIGVFDGNGDTVTTADQWESCDALGANCVPSSVFLLGYDTPGGSSSQFNAGFRVGSIWQAPASGTLTEIVAYMQGSISDGRDQDFRAVLYNASDANTPTSLVDAGAPVTVHALGAPGWVRFPVNGSVTSGQYYMLALWSADRLTGSGAFATLFYDATGGALGHYHAETYNAVTDPADPWGTDGTEDKRWAIYGALAATDSHYPVQAPDVGGTVRIKVTATNSGGSTPAESLPTGVVADSLVAPSNTHVPTFSGTEQEGETLADLGEDTWDGDPVREDRQWRRCNSSGASCSDIAGATDASYVLQAADVAGTVRLRKTARNIAGSTPADSAASGVIAAADPDVPVLVSSPTLFGPAKYGDILSIVRGNYTNNPDPTLSTWKWYLANSTGGSAVEISGETDQAYVVRLGDVGHTIIGEETPANANGAGDPQVTAHSAVVTGKGAAISGLSDTFTGALDAAKWSHRADTGTSVATSGGHLVLDLAATDDTEAEIETVADWDLTGGVFSVQFLNGGNPDDSTEQWWMRLARSDTDWVEILAVGRTATAQVVVDGVATIVATGVWKPGWLQISEASGTLTFKWALTYAGLADAPSSTVANPFAVTALQARIGISRGEPA